MDRLVRQIHWALPRELRVIVHEYARPKCSTCSAVIEDRFMFDKYADKGPFWFCGPECYMREHDELYGCCAEIDKSGRVCKENLLCPDHDSNQIEGLLFEYRAGLR